MKKLPLILFASSVLFVNCMSHDDATQVNVPIDKSAVIENAKAIFGDIDPNQDWSSINQGQVTLTADADLENIVKVQILTEPPVGQANPTILNEATVKNNETVTLAYDAPSVYEVLFAACINSEGKYYVKAFSVGEKEVSFNESVAAARMTRAGETYPSLSSIVLGEPTKSFNALRAEASEATGYVIINDNTNGKGSNRRYTNWYQDENHQSASWKNDYLWAPVNATDGNWKIENGTIYKKINESVDLTTMQWLVQYYLPKNLEDGKTKANNWQSIVEGTNYFKEYKNHFKCDGTPLTIVPLQMYTTEGKYNSIYYYYFPKTAIDGKSDEEIANYIKALPKFKAIVGYSGNGSFKREKKYLLPYYGDGAVVSGQSPVSLSIPKDHLVGFMTQKANGVSISQCMNGCTYGFGPLNIENNHIFGHYFSAMDTSVEMKSIKEKTDGTLEEQTKYGSTTSGMTWNSPRIGIFGANNKAYLCFEDGSDCNFCDMILEISSGVELEEEPAKPTAASYVMCFEDEPETADYDMNDVVLRGIRLNDSQIEISLIACGANDELQIDNLYKSSTLAGKEVHNFFGVTPGKGFINTVKGQDYKTPVSEVFNIDKSVSIEDFMSKITIFNKTTGKIIGMPKAGEAPYAIIVPMNFRYPIELCSITKAYPDFIKWAQNRSEATDWYLNGTENNLYPDMFSKAE